MSIYLFRVNSLTHGNICKQIKKDTVKFVVLYVQYINI